MCYGLRYLLGLTGDGQVCMRHQQVDMFFSSSHQAQRWQCVRGVLVFRPVWYLQRAVKPVLLPAQQPQAEHRWQCVRDRQVCDCRDESHLLATIPPQI